MKELISNYFDDIEAVRKERFSLFLSLFSNYISRILLLIWKNSDSGFCL